MAILPKHWKQTTHTYKTIFTRQLSSIQRDTMVATRKLHVNEIQQINWNKAGAPDSGSEINT